MLCPEVPQQQLGFVGMPMTFGLKEPKLVTWEGGETENEEVS